MRQRILSWGDDFTIKDADGRADTYTVDIGDGQDDLLILAAGGRHRPGVSP
jgi:uncharacterized protein YxjI